MKDEIKEILDNLDFEVNHTHNWIEPLGLDQKVWKQLLDYITNLQEENENKDNKILELQQELLNKKLNVKDIEYKEKMIYKSRNEKAIEYIKDLCYIESENKWFTYGDDLSPEHIVNILQGEDKENLYKYTPEKGFRLVGDEDV